jgi:hypothetical protein
VIEPLVTDDSHTEGPYWVVVREYIKGFFLAERKLYVAAHSVVGDTEGLQKSD